MNIINDHLFIMNLFVLKMVLNFKLKKNFKNIIIIEKQDFNFEKQAINIYIRKLNFLSIEI